MNRFTHQRVGSVLLGVSVLGTITSGAAAQQYKGVDLYALAQPPAHFQIGGLETTGDIASGGQVVGFYFSGPNSAIRTVGLVWDEPTGVFVDLTPSASTGFNSAVPYATDGVRQVGEVFNSVSGSTHAALWSGTAQSLIDLHPTLLPHIAGSFAAGLVGSQQVGGGAVPIAPNMGRRHALLWNGTAESAIDLHPTNLPGFDNSTAVGTDGVSQVGWGDGPVTGGFGTSFAGTHALFWNGTSDSAIDLHPNQLSSFSRTYALDVAGGQQVGYGDLLPSLSTSHALLWSGNSESAVDLHPTSFPNNSSSIAFATNGLHQVGVGNGHALLWTGSAQSAVDLGALLPEGFTSSVAYSIAEDETIFGTAIDASGQIHAVRWAIIPEPTPAVMALLAVAAIGVIKRSHLA
jgi:hypothetical protein